MTALAKLEHDYSTGLVDAKVDASTGFIALADGLDAPVFLSLFSDRRARPSDRVEGQHRRGWWGDAHALAPGDRWGSHLWLLRRAPLTLETVRRAQDYAKTALEWLVVDGLASSVSVTATRDRDRSAIVLRVDVARPDGSQWSRIWDIHGRLVDAVQS